MLNFLLVKCKNAWNANASYPVISQKIDSPCVLGWVEVRRRINVKINLRNNERKTEKRNAYLSPRGMREHLKQQHSRNTTGDIPPFPNESHLPFAQGAGDSVGNVMIARNPVENVLPRPLEQVNKFSATTQKRLAWTQTTFQPTNRTHNTINHLTPCAPPVVDKTPLYFVAA